MATEPPPGQSCHAAYGIVAQAAALAPHPSPPSQRISPASAAPCRRPEAGRAVPAGARGLWLRGDGSTMHVLRVQVPFNVEYVRKLVKEEREKAAKAGGGPVYTYNTEARAGPSAAPCGERAAPCPAQAAAACMPGTRG